MAKHLVSQINKETPRFHFIPYFSVEQDLEDNYMKSIMVMSLNSMCKFHHIHYPADRPFWFFKDDYHTRKWGEIPIQ